MLIKCFNLIVVILICFVAIACDKDEDNKTKFLNKGIELYQQGKFAESKLEIRNSIQKNPYIAEAHYYLALLNEKTGKYRVMKGNLIESIKLNPQYHLAKIKLGQVYLLFNELDEALNEVNEVLLENPQRIEAQILKATILVSQNKNDKALFIINSILQKNANNTEAISLKTSILVKQKSFSEVLILLESAIEKNVNNASLYLLKARVDYSLNNFNAVIETYEKLVELKPDDVQIKYSLAKSYQKANKTPKAERLLRSIVNKKPKLMGAKLMLLDFLYISNREAADNQLDLFIKTYKNDYPVLIGFSKWLIGRGEKSKAIEILNFILNQNNVAQQETELAYINLSIIDISNKQYKHGLTYLDKVLDSNPENIFADLLKAEIQIVTENYSDASKTLEEALWYKPNMDRALSLLGTVNTIRGNRKEAVHNYNDALEVNAGNLVALDFIIDSMLSEGYVDYAIIYLEKALKLLPNQLTILTKLIELNLNKNEWDSAKKYIDKLQQIENGQILAQYFKGRVFQKQRQCGVAISIYKKILEKSPELKNALFAMTECHLEQNKQKTMMKYLGSFIENNPNLIFPIVLKSRLLSLQKKYLSASKLINGFLKKKDINHVSLFIELASINAARYKKDAEYNAYKEGLKHNPNNVDLLLLLASFYEDSKDYNNAVETYHKVLKLNPMNSVAKNNLATLLLDQFGKKDNITESLRLTESFYQSKNPYFLDTYGWAQFKAGNLDKALSIFKQVIIQEPDIAIFRYHLAVALNDLGDSMAAALELKQALHLMKEQSFPEKTIIKELLDQIEE